MSECILNKRARIYFPSLKQIQAPPYKHRPEESGTVWSLGDRAAGPGDPLRLPGALSNLVLAPSWALT